MLVRQTPVQTGSVNEPSLSLSNSPTIYMMHVYSIWGLSESHDVRMLCLFFLYWFSASYSLSTVSPVIKLKRDWLTGLGISWNSLCETTVIDTEGQPVENGCHVFEIHLLCYFCIFFSVCLWGSLSALKQSETKLNYLVWSIAPFFPHSVYVRVSVCVRRVAKGRAG